MPSAAEFISATPILASLDIRRTVDFYTSRLGFTLVHAEQGMYGIVAHGPVHLHFWPCTDRNIAEATACRIQVKGVDRLHEQCRAHGIVHPNAALMDKPWGSREFAILDPDGNLVTFHEPTAE